MNKAEKAELEAAKTAAALCWTSPVPFDVGVPDSGRVSGWCYNPSALSVWEGWTEKCHHEYGKAPSEYSALADWRKMHSTKLLALKAMRYEVALRAAGELRAIDKMIERAEAEQ